MKEKAALQALVYGHVQGVFFRAFVQEKAESLGINGYVRNLPTGEVEVFAEGNTAELEKLVENLKIGPPAAKVTDLKLQWLKYSGKYSQFFIKY
jgi:acylphosphatase